MPKGPQFPQVAGFEVLERVAGFEGAGRLILAARAAGIELRPHSGGGYGNLTLVAADQLGNLFAHAAEIEREEQRIRESSAIGSNDVSLTLCERFCGFSLAHYAEQLKLPTKSHGREIFVNRSLLGSILSAHERERSQGTGGVTDLSALLDFIDRHNVTGITYRNACRDQQIPRDYRG
jgi:hypothetical protein